MKKGLKIQRDIMNETAQKDKGRQIHKPEKGRKTEEKRSNNGKMSRWMMKWKIETEAETEEKNAKQTAS